MSAYFGHAITYKDLVTFVVIHDIGAHYFTVSEKSGLNNGMSSCRLKITSSRTAKTAAQSSRRGIVNCLRGARRALLMIKPT